MYEACEEVCCPQLWIQFLVLSYHKNRSCLRRSRNGVRVGKAMTKLETMTFGNRLKKLGVRVVVL